MPGDRHVAPEGALLLAPPDQGLELVSTRLFDDRLQLLEYVPTVLAGPPGAGDNGS
jgi:hypothetical protein